MNDDKPGSPGALHVRARKNGEKEWLQRRTMCCAGQVSSAEAQTSQLVMYYTSNL